MNFCTAHLSYSELERLHYQFGSTDAAALYARLEDLEAEQAEYEIKIGDMYEEKDMKEKEAENEALRLQISTANSQLTDLYRTLDDAKRISKGPILTALATIDLELP